jgi:hypothetical protein
MHSDFTNTNNNTGDKVALEEEFLQAILFSLISNIPPVHYIHINR